MTENNRPDNGDVPEVLRNLTENEWAWVEFLRLLSNGRDPELRLRDVQLLRRLLQRQLKTIEGKPEDSFEAGSATLLRRA